MRRFVLALTVIAVVLIAAPAGARPYWKKQLDRMASRHRVGIALHDDGTILYEHDARTKRIPASNEKLLLSMALFDALGPRARIQTRLYSPAPTGAAIVGDLWIQGRGDPTITAGGAYGRFLPFSATGIGDLARAVKKAGVVSITGRVMGSTGYFARDWDAPGWKSYFPDDEVPLPTALTYEGNVRRGRHIRNPEIRAARALTSKLERLGIEVGKRADAGKMPGGLAELAHVRSVPLSVLVRYMNRKSSNFFAEVFGKRLAAEVHGPPGSIAAGARAIEAFANRLGIELAAFDSSGLSYRNRVAPRGIVRLLTDTELNAPWYEVLRRGLPTGGQGTLEDRLHGIKIRAKTGSLSGASALSGWLKLRRTGGWAEFSILSQGLDYYAAKGLEDRIVRMMHRFAR